MVKIFRKFDPRISQELRSQRKTIAKGLACVLLTSVLTAVMIPLTAWAIDAIQDATPVKTSIFEAIPGERDFAKAADPDLSVEAVREKLNPLVKPEASLPSDAEIAKALGITEEQSAAVRAKVAAKGELDIQSVIEKEGSGFLHSVGTTVKGWQKWWDGQDPLWRLTVICLTVVALFGIKYVFTRGQAYYLSRAASSLAADLRRRLFAKLQKMPVSYFNQKRTGAIQSVLTNDVGVYQSAVNMIRDSIDGPVKATLAFVSIFLIQWQLALVAMLFIPVMAWFVDRNGKKMKAAQASVQEDLSEIAAMSNEALSGTRVIKAFSAEERIGGLYNQLVSQQFESQMRAARRFAQLRPMVELIGAVSLALILLICGFMAKSGLLQISQIVALTFALDVINQGARSLASVNNTYNQVQAAADRIYREVLDVEEEHLGSRSGRTIENPQGRIEFKDVGFVYADGTRALDKVSFVIEPGKSLALVGPSGAGKSTIADLMLRFYDPTEGSITFDGVDYRDLKVEWLRQQFGVVPQQTLLFAGSIRDNLRLGSPDASLDKLNEALASANAREFVEKAPDGLETVLGERGVRLSGGEGQRLAIARALVRDPIVMLLDEATSNLDAHSEKVVTEALERVMQSRTTLFIAHRLTTAARASAIVMLRQGQILEKGTHDDLIRQKGSYAAMYQAFTSGLIPEL